MATIAEEFKEDFEANIRINDWDSLDELVYALGYSEDVEDSGFYNGKFSGYVLDKEYSDREYCIFKDRSWVVTEFCRQSTDNPEVADGFVHLMPYPVRMTYAEMFREELEKEHTGLVERGEKIAAIAHDTLAVSTKRTVELMLHTHITFSDGSVLHAGSGDGESRTSYE